MCLALLQVAYVFSDKTGTLTSNEMQLRQIAIEGTSYGHADFRSGRRWRLCSVWDSHGAGLPGAVPWHLTRESLSCGRLNVLTAIALRNDVSQGIFTPLQCLA